MARRILNLMSLPFKTGAIADEESAIAPGNSASEASKSTTASTSAPAGDHSSILPFSPTTTSKSSTVAQDPQEGKNTLSKDSPTESSLPESPEARRRRVRRSWCLFALAMLFLLLITAMGLLVTALTLDQSTPGTTVNLDYATYIGTATQGTGVTKWLGIRYAHPPIGNLRFRAPVEPPVTNRTINANQHGPICLSTGATSFTANHSEDCLYLDVYAPTRSDKDGQLVEEKFPVYVFFQGGGFNELSNANYDGTSLVQASDHKIIIVTFNYRVGPYGFLASKEVEADGDLNVGLLDQRMVLEWVQKYISQFGGDPDHVTIGGDSAGGASVDLHLSAYGGRDDGLFHAAAAESQSFGAQFTVEQSQYQYDDLVNRTGCSDADNTLACLRNLPIKVLQGNNTVEPTPGGAGGDPLFMYSNVIDGNFTEDYTYRMFATGRYIKVPVIFGDTTNEGTIFTPTDTDSVDDMNDFLKDNFVNITDAQLSQIDDFYPEGPQFSSKGTYFSAAATAYGEMRYICPGIYLSGVYANASLDSDEPNTSWNYRYNVEDPTLVAEGLGVPHVAEVTQIWGMGTSTSSVIQYNGTGTNVRSTSSNSTQSSSIQPYIQGYWTSFIRSKDPNVHRYPGSPVWKSFDPTQLTRLKFQLTGNGTQMESVPSNQRTRCAYLTSIGVELEQ